MSALSYLIGNPELDRMEIEDEMREDARFPYPSGALPDELAAEMDAAFGYDVPPTEAEMEAARREWADNTARNESAAAFA